MGRWPKEVTPIVLLEWRFYLMPSSLALLSCLSSFIARLKRRSFLQLYCNGHWGGPSILDVG